VIEGDKEVCFNSDGDEEDRRSLPFWINEWLEEVNEKVEDEKGKSTEEQKKIINGFKGLRLGFPRLKALRSVTRM